ncbi:MAG TPA: acylphosphatase [Kiloniellales bacterium]|nr:acylphosphatase [Kiloniellales bacterium]
MVETQRKHVFVAGRVQGVWFRAWTEQQAKELGLSGWVRNRQDGRVEAVIAGSPPAVSSMLKRLRQGPPSAKVEAIEVSDWQEAVPAGFQTKPSV